MVSFRLTEDEYDQIRVVCINSGLRSISEFARAATCHWASDLPGDAEDSLRHKILQLDQKISELDGKFRKLNQFVEVS